jgi:hypothetical protein
MTLSDDDLRERGRRPVRARGPDCIGEEDWLRQMTGEASPAERMRLARHLAVCTTCADEYRALHALRSWADEASDVVAGEAGRRQWRAWSWPLGATWTRAALAASVVIVVVQGVVLLQMSAARWTEGAALVARERSLGDAAAALSAEQARRRELEADAAAEIATLRASVEELSMPQLDSPIVDLDPRGATRAAPPPSDVTVDVPRSGGSLTLILNFPPLAADSVLRVDLMDERGRQIWQGRTSRAAGSGSLNLTLVRRELPSGVYVIRVARLAGAAPSALADYRVRIRDAGQGIR